MDIFVMLNTISKQIHSYKKYINFKYTI